MLRQIEASLERFRIHFDSWALQSELASHLPELLERLDTYERDGAVWIRSTAFGDEKDRVLIRSAERGGLPTYEAADIVYLRDKLERGFDRAIYVLGADHHGVRGWYGVIAQMLGYDPDRVEVILYQLVHLTRGGDVVKMSKRRGDVVTLDEFMDEVGVDAARWYLAARGPDQAITIDVDLAREKSEKNPVYYVQYAHARIAGILRRAEGPRSSAEAPPALAPEERDLVKRLAEFPAIAAEAARAPQPAGAADVRDPAGRRLPPLLPPPPRAGERRAGVPPRARHRREGRDRAQPRPRRGRGARADVARRRAVNRTLRDTCLHTLESTSSPRGRRGAPCLKVPVTASRPPTGDETHERHPHLHPRRRHDREPRHR